MSNQKFLALKTHLYHRKDNFDSLYLDIQLLRGMYSYGFNVPRGCQNIVLVPLIQGRSVFLCGDKRTFRSTAALIAGIQRITWSCTAEKFGTFSGDISERKHLGNWEAAIITSDAHKAKELFALGSQLADFTPYRLQLASNDSHFDVPFQMAIGTPEDMLELMRKQDVKHLHYLVFDDLEQMVPDFETHLNQILNLLESNTLFLQIVVISSSTSSFNFFLNKIDRALMFTYSRPIHFGPTAHFYVDVQEAWWQLSNECRVSNQ